MLGAILVAAAAARPATCAPPAELRKLLEAGNSTAISFELASAELPESASPLLDAIARWMLEDERIKVRLIGRTCDLGTRAANLKLSKARVENVARALLDRGVPPPSIHTEAKGSDAPVAPNRDEDGRRRNRSVEIQFLKRGWKAVY